MSLSSAIKYRLAASAVVLLSLCSCGEDGVDGPVKMTCTDLVTFSGNVGERATFTFQKMDDSPEITLTAQSTLASDDIEVGTRLLISYIPEGNQAYISGPVTLLGGRVVTQSAITAEWRDEYDAWDKDKVYVYSAWRTGPYLNVHVRLTYSAEPRIFCLAADPATLNSAWPEVYLVHVIDGDVDNHDRAYYASFDISEVWSRPSTEGIRLHVANSNLDKQIFTFAKGL